MQYITNIYIETNLKYISVVGSRGFGDYDFFLDNVNYYTRDIKEAITFVSGAANSGADALIAKFCKEHDVPIIEYKAEWSKYGKSAGLKRNVLIIEKSDFVLAFWDGKSRGTAHTIKLAKKLNKPLRIVKIK